MPAAPRPAGHWGHPPLAKGGTWSGHRGVTLGNTVCPARYTSVRGPTTGENSPPSGLTSAWGNPGFRNRNPTTAQPHTASNLLSAHSSITQPAERGNLTVSRLPSDLLLSVPHSLQRLFIYWKFIVSFFLICFPQLPNYMDSEWSGPIFP